VHFAREERGDRDDWRDERRMRSSVTNSDTNLDATMAAAISLDVVCIFQLAPARARQGYGLLNPLRRIT
jgi:hypothetical protein